MFRAAAFILAAAFALAGCGGRASLRSVLPGTLGAPSRSAPGMQSSNVNLFNGTLWYGDGPVLLGVSLQSGGSDARIEGSLDGIVDAVPRAMTIAPDGTLYDLIESGGTSWRMQMFAPGARGAAQPEQYIDGIGSPREVVLVGDGIDVLSVTSPGTTSQSAVLWTYAYAAGDAPRPVRSLPLGPNVSDVAADGSGRIYAAHSDGSGIDVYPAGATCRCSRLRTIATRARSNDAIAIGPDGTVYVLSKDEAAGTSTIDAYAPGAAGPQPSRTIGPFTRARGLVTGGITVDSDGNLYAGFEDARHATSADVFAPNASGTPSPLRTLPIPTHAGFVTSIAIGPLVPPPSARGEIFVLYCCTHADVYALEANGPTQPERFVSGLERAYMGSNNGGMFWITQALAAAHDGTLYAVEGHTGTPDGYTVAVFPPPGGVTTGLPGQPPEYAGFPDAAALSRDGSTLHVLYHDATGRPFVNQVLPAGNSAYPIPVNSLGGLALDPVRGGDDVPDGRAAVVDNFTISNPVGPRTGGGPQVVTRYVGAVDPDAQPLVDGIAVAADGTIYVGIGSPNGMTPPRGVPLSIAAFAPGANENSRPSRTITGSFTYPIQLAVDAAGELVVFHDKKVDTFAPTANGPAAPLRSFPTPNEAFGPPYGMAVTP